MTDQPSKSQVLDALCKTLGVDDYTMLEGVVTSMLQAATSPLCGIMIVWNPRVQNSMAYGVLGVPPVPDAIQRAATVCSIVSQELSAKALAAAQGQTVARGQGLKNGPS